MGYQPDDLYRHDRQQQAQELGAEPLTLADLRAVIDWLTDAISALEADNLNTGGLLVLVWLKGKRRELNTQLLALSAEGEVLE